jgi:pyruvate dehydrogenase E2 component (dihydrolipoamide acetyltransferase)
VILAKPQTPQTIKSTGGERVKISPLAKKLAKEKEIDISELKPSAPGKRIVKNDVLNFTPPVSQTTAMRQSTILSIDEQDVLETIPLSGVRKVIANRMSESNLEKPCVALTLTVIADEIVRVREMFKEHDIKVSYNDIITKIVAQSLCKHRNINAVLNGDSIQLLKHVNIGIAVDSEKGLVVPVIKDADKKSIRQIAQDFSEKVTAIRENTIRGEDLTGGTFTITNLGMFEIEEFTPIINPPECCILAVGAMKKVFVPDEQERPKLVTEMKLTLVFDHRIVDGAPAAKFLQCVKHYIECPEFLL